MAAASLDASAERACELCRPLLERLAAERAGSARPVAAVPAAKGRLVDAPCESAKLAAQRAEWAAFESQFGGPAAQKAAARFPAGAKNLAALARRGEGARMRVQLVAFALLCHLEDQERQAQRWPPQFSLQHESSFVQVLDRTDMGALDLHLTATVHAHLPRPEQLAATATVEEVHATFVLPRLAFERGAARREGARVSVWFAPLWDGARVGHAPYALKDAEALTHCDLAATLARGPAEFADLCDTALRRGLVAVEANAAGEPQLQTTDAGAQQLLEWGAFELYNAVMATRKGRAKR